MRILAGGPAVDIEADYFKAHLETLQHQRFSMDPDQVQVDILHLDGVNPEGSYSVEGGHHKWRDEDFEWMARLRQSFLNRTLNEGYDAAFMVDTDLLLGDGVLQALIDCPSPITYGVFWTRWAGAKHDKPQVWERHGSEEWAPDSKALGILLRGGRARVYGGGACSLIWTSAIDRGARYHPRLESLPSEKMWRGEDRTFALTAEVNGLDQMAVGGLPIIHLYDGMARKPRAVARAMKRLYS